MVTGGIDLSVGSMMGLAAVVFGAVWQDWDWPIPGRVLFALLLVARGRRAERPADRALDIPPLIVTLGSFSLFRGIAEGITGGAVNYRASRRIPVARPGISRRRRARAVSDLLAGARRLLRCCCIARRSGARSTPSASARRARATPAFRCAPRLALIYFLSGVVGELAAIIYVAHLGQAKSDAGTGYELAAITAVVLGGTSIFGGRGTVWGTLFGLFAMSVLQNGLRLAALPSELTGVLTGIAADRDHRARPLRTRGRDQRRRTGRADDMRNSQLAVLCGVILAGSLIVAGTQCLAGALR